MVDVRALHDCEVQGWRLAKIIGEGADGVVYEGYKDGNRAAVKVFFPEALQKNGYEAGLERLYLQLNLKNKHPNVVEIYEGGEAPEIGSLYLVMELVPGASLDKVIKQIPRGSIPSLVHQLAEAAQFLEQNDLVHRDIKPANIVISDDFTKLTLLDFGVAILTIEENERLSGQQFVGTTRYSPHEFVWRTEENSDKMAWRAITLYQIGATLHDMIMSYPIFTGDDEPRAKLYDSIKSKTPKVEADDCPQWLIQIAKSCLLKNWRERINLVNWDSFRGPSADGLDPEAIKNKIRLRQIIREEERVYAAEVQRGSQVHSRNSEIWTLNHEVFLETKNFLMNSSIFPRSSEFTTADTSEFKFEKNSALMFDEEITFKVLYRQSDKFELATELSVVAAVTSGRTLYEASWTEMFTVESASRFVQQALLEIADSIVQ